MPSMSMSSIDLATLRRRLPSPSERRAIRERAGLSQADLARDLDVSTTVVGLWERGKRGFSHRTLRPYVELLERLATISERAS
jgi:transcriptional regulator with XRE-family HTH domain